ncbi:hypothetical protein ACI782_23580 [Geodermatophilus sp. SYSU D00703]
MTDPAADGDGDFLTVEQMAQLRQVTPAAIRAQLRAGTLAGEQVLRGQRTVWRIPASAARRSLAGTGRSSSAVEEEPAVSRPGSAEGTPAAAPQPPSAPGAPSAPGPTPPVTGRGVPGPPPSVPSARVEALEAEVRRLRRQLSALVDAHHRLLDAVSADLADDLVP